MRVSRQHERHAGRRGRREDVRPVGEEDGGLCRRTCREDVREGVRRLQARPILEAEDVQPGAADLDHRGLVAQHPPGRPPAERTGDLLRVGMAIVIAEDREHPVTRGDACELRDPGRQVGHRRVDDVSRHADQVRLEGRHPVECVPEPAAVGERAQVEIAQVDDAKSRERGGQGHDRHVEPGDDQATVAAQVAVDDRPHGERDERQRHDLESTRQRERLARAGQHAGLRRMAAEDARRDPEPGEHQERTGAGECGEPARHEHPRRPIDERGQPRLALEDARGEPVQQGHRGQREQLKSRGEGAERRQEPAGEDPLADRPGDREAREEPAEEELIDHLSGSSQPQPGMAKDMAPMQISDTRRSPRPSVRMRIGPPYRSDHGRGSRSRF